MSRISDTSFPLIPRASSLHYALLYVEHPKQAAATVLMAFYHEIINIVQKGLEPQVAVLKLSWWSTEIDRTYRHSPQHPITQALLPIIQQFQLPEEWFQCFLEGIKIEVDCRGFEKMEDFSHFLQLRAGIDKILSLILTHPAPPSEAFVTYWSMSLQLIDLIRFFGKAIKRGIIYFPEEDLQDISLTASAIDKNCSPETYSPLLLKEAQRAKEYYVKAMTYLNEQDRYAHSSHIMLGNIQFALLDEITKDNFPVMCQKISLTPLRKFWIAWRTHATEKKKFNMTR